MIKYFFFKNTVFVLPSFFFQFLCLASTEKDRLETHLYLYNTIFTRYWVSKKSVFDRMFQFHSNFRCRFWQNLASRRFGHKSACLRSFFKNDLLLAFELHRSDDRSTLACDRSILLLVLLLQGVNRRDRFSLFSYKHGSRAVQSTVSAAFRCCWFLFICSRLVQINKVRINPCG